MLPNKPMLLTLADRAAARDELARRYLRDFACSVDIPTVPLSEDPDEPKFEGIRQPKLAAHHSLLLNACQNLGSVQVPNLMVLMPPGSAKSTYVDVVYVPWFMARKPRSNVILASYASDIAKKQGRRARQLIKGADFRRIWPDAELRQDQSAADEWALANGSEYMAGGILSGLTGNRAALGVLDDPIKGRQQAESQTIRDTTWDAYVDDFCSRLIPGAPQIMILCMTGDTRVLMGDTSEKRLKDIRAGDMVASYHKGRLVASRVAAWRNNGPDSVFEITMTSGITVKANERHPFLVDRGGELEWVRLKNISVGDRILRVIGGSGGGQCVQNQSATSQSPVRASVQSTTAGSDGLMAIVPHLLRAGLEKISSYATATASALMSTKPCSKARAVSAQSARGQDRKARQIIGRTGSASITTTTLERSADFSATTAISLLAEAGASSCSRAPLNTLSVMGEAVVSILPCGHEDVFDIQVERTENFIANGLVSHNTRWHADDPAGRILPEDWDGESGMFEGRDGRWWHVICLPAIADRMDDPLDRAIGETLWPEWFSQAHWAPFQKNVRTWTSLYQQKPSAEEGTFFKMAWFKRYSEKPKFLNIYMTSDHAPGGTEHNDFNVFRVWGVDEHQHIWLLDGYRVQGTIDVAMGVKLDEVTGEQALADEGALPLIKKWKPLCWFPENDNNWKSSEPFVRAAMRRVKVLCRIEAISTAGGDKATKAQPFQAKAAMGEVHIPVGPMGDEVLEQYKKFPSGRWDDEVDAAANIGRAIDMAHPAIVKLVVPSSNPSPGDYRPKRTDQSASAWG